MGRVGRYLVDFCAPAGERGDFDAVVVGFCCCCYYYFFVDYAIYESYWYHRIYQREDYDKGGR